MGKFMKSAGNLLTGMGAVQKGSRLAETSHAWNITSTKAHTIVYYYIHNADCVLVNFCYGVCQAFINHACVNRV